MDSANERDGDAASEAVSAPTNELQAALAELRSTAKDLDSMGYGLIAIKLNRLEAILSRASQPTDIAELRGAVARGYCHEKDRHKEELDSDLLVAIVEEVSALSRASGPEPLRDKTLRLRHALKAILEIGKRDMSNPKYDGYFEEADLAIKSFDAPAAPTPVLGTADALGKPDCTKNTAEDVVRGKPGNATTELPPRPIMERAHEFYELHTAVGPLPNNWPAEVACKCGAILGAESFEALQIMWAHHQIEAALAAFTPVAGGQ